MSLLTDVMKTINKEAKAEVATQGIVKINMPKIPLTSLRLNYMLYGGLPRGCIIEFFGSEGGGKTTSALDAIKNSQLLFKAIWEHQIEQLENNPSRTNEETSRLEYLQARGALKCVFIDCENTLSEEWCKVIGVNLDELIVIKPREQPAEVIFEWAVNIADTGEVGLIVLDSIGVMLSAQAYNKTMEEKTYGGISKPLTLFAQKMTMLCYKHHLTLIGINQIREDLNAQYANAYTTPGGKAWKHACSLRLEFRKGYYINEKNERLTNADAVSPCGNVVDVAIKKTKVCKPDRLKGMFTLNYEKGIDEITDFIELCLKADICTQRGSYFYFYDAASDIRTWEGVILKFQGKANLYNYLSQNKSFLDVLYKELSEKLIL